MKFSLPVRQVGDEKVRRNFSAMESSLNTLANLVDSLTGQFVSLSEEVDTLPTTQPTVPKVAAGTVVFTTLVAGVKEYQTVTFPEGRFPSAPSVSLGVGTTSPATITVSIATLTATSVVVYIQTTADYSSVTVNWLAIERG